MLEEQARVLATCKVVVSKQKESLEVSFRLEISIKLLNWVQQLFTTNTSARACSKSVLVACGRVVSERKESLEVSAFVSAWNLYHAGQTEFSISVLISLLKIYRGFVLLLIKIKCLYTEQLIIIIIKTNEFHSSSGRTESGISALLSLLKIYLDFVLLLV